MLPSLWIHLKPLFHFKELYIHLKYIALTHFQGIFINALSHYHPVLLLLIHHEAGQSGIITQLEFSNHLTLRFPFRYQNVFQRTKELSHNWKFWLYKLFKVYHVGFLIYHYGSKALFVQRALLFMKHSKRKVTSRNPLKLLSLEPECHPSTHSFIHTIQFCKSIYIELCSVLRP